jgi:hypothetical protein
MIFSYSCEENHKKRMIKVSLFDLNQDWPFEVTNEDRYVLLLL